MFDSDPRRESTGRVRDRRTLVTNVAAVRSRAGAEHRRDGGPRRGGAGASVDGQDGAGRQAVDRTEIHDRGASLDRHDGAVAPGGAALGGWAAEHRTRSLVRRQLEKDALQLVTIGKELTFRLSDHISEYTFPQYSFKGDAWQLKYIKPGQDRLLKHEGFADHIRVSE